MKVGDFLTECKDSLLQSPDDYQIDFDYQQSKSRISRMTNPAELLSEGNSQPSCVVCARVCARCVHSLTIIHIQVNI